MTDTNRYEKNILMICPFSRPNVGGVETHLDKLVHYLSKLNYYTTLLTYQPLSNPVKGERFEKSDYYEIHRMQWFGVGLFDKLETKFPLVFLYVFPGLFLKSIYYYFKNHTKIDCIHAHGLVAAVIAVCCKLVSNKRTVLSTHAIYNFEDRKPILKNFVRIIIKYFDKIIAVSEVSKRELQKLGIAEEKIVCFKNWVDTDLFSPMPKDELHTKSDKPINFLFLSRFIEKKGLLLYLKVASNLPQANFYIVGGGQLEDAVRKAEEKSNNIKYSGLLSQTKHDELQKMVELYNLADYFVSPYLYDEGYSATLLESVCCGTKVVIPNRGSPPKFLSPEVVEYLPEEIDETILEDKLRDLVSNPKDQFSINACRTFGLENLGFKNAKIISDAYDE